jgi:hypothetical protein
MAYVNASPVTYIANMCSTMQGANVQGVNSLNTNASTFSISGIILYNTTIIGLSFANFGFYQFPSPGSQITMQIYKMTVSGTVPSLPLATMTITNNSAIAGYNSTTDGTLFIIPFIQGTTFGLNTSPITSMPTCISAVSGNISDPNKLAFSTGDVIQITLTSSAPFTAGISALNTPAGLAGSILCSNSSGAKYNDSTLFNIGSSGFSLYNSGVNFSISTIAGGSNGTILTRVIIPPIVSLIANNISGASLLWTLTISYTSGQNILTVNFVITSVNDAMFTPINGAVASGYASPLIDLTLDAIQVNPLPGLRITQIYGNCYLNVNSNTYINSYPMIPKISNIQMALTNSATTSFYYAVNGTTTSSAPAFTLNGILY